MTESPVLHTARPRTEPALDHLWRADIVCSTTKRRPDACQEIVQVSGDETGELAGSCIGTVDDEGHEEHGEGEVFTFEGDDEEGYGTRGIILGERVGVCEGQRGEESVLVQNATCCCLYGDC